MPPTLGAHPVPSAAIQADNGTNPPPRRCGGGLMPWHPMVRCRLKEGGGTHWGEQVPPRQRKDWGESRALQASKRNVRAVLSVGVTGPCASTFCPHLCRHSEISATSSSGMVGEVRIRWRNRQKTTHSEGSAVAHTGEHARRGMRATRSGIPSRPPIGPRTPPRIRRDVTPVRTTRTPPGGSLLCRAGEPTV